MELQRNSHHVFRIMYHFVWIPKYRRKVFSEPYRSTLKDIIFKIGYDYNIEIIEQINYSDEDVEDISFVIGIHQRK